MDGERYNALMDVVLAASTFQPFNAFTLLQYTGTPPGIPGGVRLATDYLVIIFIKQQPPGQQEPPPQQSSFDDTGVAAVSVKSAAKTSMYFITPPFELRSNLGACTHRAVSGGVKRAVVGSAGARRERCRRFR